LDLEEKRITAGLEYDRFEITPDAIKSKNVLQLGNRLVDVGKKSESQGGTRAESYA
jgi:hypothetical protein